MEEMKCDSEMNDENLFHPLNPHLNSRQIEAVNFSLQTPYLSLIHGPPGFI